MLADQLVYASRPVAVALVALSLALCVRSVAADPVTATLPFAPPERPFLLVDAPRRFLPGEGAFVRVQNQYGGPVQIGVFRLHAVQSFVAEPIDRQGVSIASSVTCNSPRGVR